MKKKVIAFMMCGAMILSLAACGSSGNSSNTETTSETEEEPTLTKTEYIKLAKETGYRAIINLTYLTQFAYNEIIYASYADTMSDEIADSAFATIEEYFGITKSAIIIQFGDVLEDYGSNLKNIPDDEEAQEWYDAVAPLCQADMSLYSATCSNLDKYESASEFSNTVSELTENLNDLANDFYHFETDHPVAGTDFHAGYYFSYPEEWWTKTSDDGTYYYIYPEENTADGFVMIFYEEMSYGDPLTNVTMGALSIENSSSVVDVESDTGTLVNGFEASEVVYTQDQNGTEYNTDAYVIAQGNEGVVCVSLVVPTESSADYSEGFNEVLNSITYTGLDFSGRDDATEAEEEIEESEEAEAEVQTVEKTVTHDFNGETNQIDENASGVRFDVPQTWEKQEVTKSGSRYYRTYLMGKDSLIVTYENTNNYGDSYKPYEDDILSSLEADYNDFTLINTSEREIFDDKVALEVTFTWKSADESYEDTALFFKYGAELIGFYLQSAQSSEYDRSEDFESVINSFHSTERGSNDSEEDASEVTSGERNALQSAKNYLNTMPFAYSELIGQLEYEGYTEEEATYAADNCGADWNEQAALKAQDYLDIMAYSRDELISQLEYEGFTAEQAEYGVSSVMD